MALIDVARKNRDSAADELMKNPNQLEDFLNYYSIVYKLKVHNALIMHSLNPSNYLIADKEQWVESYSRSVKRNQRGIPCLNDTATLIDMYYTAEQTYFSPSDSMKKETEPKLWILNDNVRRFIANSVGAVDFHDVIDYYVDDMVQQSNVNEYFGDVRTIDLAVKIGKYMFATRCDYGATTNYADTYRLDDNDLALFSEIVGDDRTNFMNFLESADEIAREPLNRMINELTANVQLARQQQQARQEQVQEVEVQEAETETEVVKEEVAEVTETVDEVDEAPVVEMFEDADMATYAIYQMKGGDDYHYYRYESLEANLVRGFEPNIFDYEKVYENTLDAPDNQSLEGLLDLIYETFNNKETTPDDFEGHALAVSDVIVITENDIDSAYYVDSFGFKEVSSFLNETPRILNDEHIEDDLHDFAEAIGVDEAKLRYACKLHLDERTINQFDRLEEAATIVDRKKARAFFERLNNETIVDHKINAYVVEAVKDFILSDGRTWLDLYDRYNAQVDDETFNKIYDNFGNYYSYIYDNRMYERSSEYDKAIDLCTDFMAQTSENALYSSIIKRFANANSDVISSDREYAAFALALADAGVIDRFSDLDISIPYEDQVKPTNGLYTYYLHRPATSGAFPQNEYLQDVVNFDEYEYRDEIGRQAWGYVTYTQRLTSDERTNYELVAMPYVETESETELPTITCEWSESNVFEEGETYSVAEFDRIMREADLAFIAGRNAAIEHYGSEKAWDDAELHGDKNDYRAFIGYRKVKFTLNMPNGDTYTERQDIGDEYGGVADFLNNFSVYRENGVVQALRDAIQIEDPEYYDKYFVNLVKNESELAEEKEEGVEEAAEITEQVPEQASEPTAENDNDSNFLFNVGDKVLFANSETEDEDEYTVNEIYLLNGEQRVELSQGTEATEENRDNVHDFATSFGVDEAMLREVMSLHLAEANINEFGRLDRLKNTINRETAKPFIDRAYGEDTPTYKMGMRIDKVLREFILSDGESYSRYVTPIQKLDVPAMDVVDYNKRKEQATNLSEGDVILLPPMKMLNTDFKTETVPACYGLVTKVNDKSISLKTYKDSELTSFSGSQTFLSSNNHWAVQLARDGFTLIRKAPQQEEIQEQSEEQTDESVREIEEIYEQEVGETTTESANVRRHNGNYVFDEHDITPNGAVARFNANVKAIETLKAIERDDREATVGEQSIFAGYVGWGGLPQAFDPNNDSWSDRYNQLKDLLDDKEYAAARSSTLTSFYTPPEVIDGIYQGLEQLGFTHGNVLEPSMGIGNFFAKMPQDKDVNLYGVELDSISARIAKKLYPDAHIKEMGFEKAGFNDNSFDVVIGNVPFGDYKVSDVKYDNLKLNIHDYFIAKSIDMVKPNGVIAVVTSKFTLDKENDSFREYIAERCELLGAVRLPQDSFTDTSTVSDILFLQKREERKVLKNREDWMDVSTEDLMETEHVSYNWDEDNKFAYDKDVKTGEIEYNNYFHTHQEMVCGKMVIDEATARRFGTKESNNTHYDRDESHYVPYVIYPSTCAKDDEIPLAESIKQAVSHITKDRLLQPLYSEHEELGEVENAVLAANPEIQNFTYVLLNGDVYYRENSELLKSTETGKTLERLKGMIEIRDTMFNLVDTESRDASEEKIFNARRDLNEVYDRFVAKYGHINEAVNQKAFKDDFYAQSVSAIENYEVVETDGKEERVYSKSPIFFRRTLTPTDRITHVDSPEDAMLVSLDELGKLNIEYMSQLCGMEKDDMIAELGDAVFRDPEKVDMDDPYSGYVAANEYLSGNIYKKIQYANENYMVLGKEETERNVAALEKVKPEPLSKEEIRPKIGAPWIDPETYDLFFEEYTGLNSKGVVYTDITGEYSYKESVSKYAAYSAVEIYGTERMNAYNLFKNLLNQRELKIQDEIVDPITGSKRRSINREETERVKEKARAMEEAFENWFWSDGRSVAYISYRESIDDPFAKGFTYKNSDYYCNKYNALYNCYVACSYDGSKQSFPNMSTEVQLRKHQKDAIMRAKIDGNTLLAHSVGAGKSFEIAAIVMEKKRLGMIHKPLVTVPKPLVGQMGVEWKKLYPQANILVASNEDFKTENRKRFIAKCAFGDYDAVIMSHEQFTEISMSKEYQEEFIDEQISDIDDLIDNTRNGYVGREEKITIKKAEAQKKKLQKRLEKVLTKSEDFLSFDRLGFDFLVCDEAHKFKNALVVTKQGSLKGVNTSDSAKADDMTMKTEYLNNKYGCNNIVFASGTPVSNSMTELYVLNRYLRPDMLEESGMKWFDNWSANFGEVTEKQELTASNVYKSTRRMGKFKNVPELKSMYLMFADIKTAEELDLPVPKITGGQPTVYVSQPTEEQKEYIKWLGERSDDVHNGIDPRIDNMLKITHEARECGLDLRTLRPDATPNPDSKIYVVADNIMKKYKETEKEKGVQVVFCDLSVNGKEENPFSFYDALQQELIARGFPKNEIVVAGDLNTEKARTKAYKQLNDGTLRLAIGSTDKLGTGVNIQERLCAVHHVDIPWRPSDLEQRNGRAIRSGNRFENVDINYYFTEDTCDAFLMDGIVRKSRFINQTFSNGIPPRLMEDLDDEQTLSYATMQAVTSSNPLIGERIQLDVDVQHLKRLEKSYYKERKQIEKSLKKEIPEKIERYTELLEKSRSDLEICMENKPKEKEPLKLVVGERTIEKREDFTAELNKAREQIKKSQKDHKTYSGKDKKPEESVLIGKCSGFDLYVEKKGEISFFSNSTYQLVLKGELSYTCDMGTNNGNGNVDRLYKVVTQDILKKNVDLTSKLNEAEQDMENARATLEKPFAQADELREKSRQLEELNEQLTEFDNETRANRNDEGVIYDDEEVVETHILGFSLKKEEKAQSKQEKSENTQAKNKKASGVRR